MTAKVYECVSFILIKDAQVLLEQRALDKASDPGEIAIPGGHIEADETQQQALIRELKEELDVVPDSFHYLCSLYHPTSELQLIHYYVIDAWQGDIRALEADQVFWRPMADTQIKLHSDQLALEEYHRVYQVLMGEAH